MEFVKGKWYCFEKDYWFQFLCWEIENSKMIVSCKIFGKTPQARYYNDIITNEEFFNKDRTVEVNINDIKHLLPKNYVYEEEIVKLENLKPLIKIMNKYGIN